MRRLILASGILIASIAPALAGFDEGLDAYLRQDYQTAYRELKPAADSGNADAQNMLGHMYARGRGVLQDYVQAHLWFNLAAVGGKSKAAASRDEVARLMTAQQIAEAQQRARQWRPKTAATTATSAAPTSQAPRLSGATLIAEIQRQLKGKGYEPGPADGVMGWQTRSSIRSYQQKHGLPINGEPSQSLLDHLWASGRSTPSKTASAAPASALSQRDLTAEIQKHLNSLGYDAGTPDGVMGWRTRSAIRSYQQQQGLAVDGLASDNLLEHLRTSAAGGTGKAVTASQAAPTAKSQTTNATANALVSDLKKLVRKGERQRLADPAYLAELRKLAAKYDANAFIQLLHDAFRDGDYTHNPAWSVASGRFTVSWDAGLSSTVAPPPAATQKKSGAEDVAIAVLSQILGAQSSSSGDSASESEAAEIVTAHHVSNYFSLTSVVTLGAGSLCQFGLYQGSGRSRGYYLQIASGAEPTLIRQTEAGAAIISTSQRSLSQEAGQQYQVEWTRGRNGRMRVRLNDREVLNVRDTAIQQKFDGVSHANRLGQCVMRSITINGTS